MIVVSIPVFYFVTCSVLTDPVLSRIVTNLSTDDKTQTPKSKTVERRKRYLEAAKTPIDPKILMSTYRANEVRADKNMKDRIVCVRGPISQIGKDIAGDSYVFFDGLRNDKGGVQCLFESDNDPILAQLQNGQVVTVCGLCRGLMMNVLVSDSSVVY